MSQGRVGTVYVGTSGWTYASWSGSFYPRGLAQRDRLEFYAEHFDTVELNATYYRWPADAQFASWHERTRDGFVFSVKAPRTLTHRGSLDDPDGVTAQVVSGLTALSSSAGPLLLQFPPSLAADLPGLGRLLAEFPASLPIAVEFRHASWGSPDTLQLLRERNVALVQIGSLDLDALTADFAYVRLHGTDPKRRYAGSYSDEQLGALADAVNALSARGGASYVYFNNTAGSAALRNAATLQRLTRKA